MLEIVKTNTCKAKNKGNDWGLLYCLSKVSKVCTLRAKTPHFLKRFSAKESVQSATVTDGSVFVTSLLRPFPRQPASAGVETSPARRRVTLSSRECQGQERGSGKACVRTGHGPSRWQLLFKDFLREAWGCFWVFVLFCFCFRSSKRLLKFKPLPLSGGMEERHQPLPWPESPGFQGTSELLLPLAGSPAGEDDVQEAVSSRLPRRAEGAEHWWFCRKLSPLWPSSNPSSINFTSQRRTARTTLKKGTCISHVFLCWKVSTFVAESVLPAGLASPPSSQAQHPLFLSTHTPGMPIEWPPRLAKQCPGPEPGQADSPGIWIWSRVTRGQETFVARTFWRWSPADWVPASPPHRSQLDWAATTSFQYPLPLHMPQLVSDACDRKNPKIPTHINRLENVILKIIRPLKICLLKMAKVRIHFGFP